MVVRVVKFSSGGTNLERFLPKNQHTQNKLLNFVTWCNGDDAKFGFGVDLLNLMASAVRGG